MGVSIFSLFFILLFLYGLPILLTMLSKKANGAEKFGWVILVFITSWLGYAVFLIIKSLLANQNENVPKT